MTVSIINTTCTKNQAGGWDIVVSGSSAVDATVELLQGTTVLDSKGVKAPAWAVPLTAPNTASPPFTVRASVGGKAPVTTVPACPP